MKSFWKELSLYSKGSLIFQISLYIILIMWKYTRDNLFPNSQKWIITHLFDGLHKYILSSFTLANYPYIPSIRFLHTLRHIINEESLLSCASELFMAPKHFMAWKSFCFRVLNRRQATLEQGGREIWHILKKIRKCIVLNKMNNSNWTAFSTLVLQLHHVNQELKPC